MIKEYYPQIGSQLRGTYYLAIIYFTELFIKHLLNYYLEGTTQSMVNTVKNIFKENSWFGGKR